MAPNRDLVAAGASDGGGGSGAVDENYEHTAGIQ